jgi:hypothetical protein
MNAVEQASIIYTLLVKKGQTRSVVSYGEVNAVVGYRGNAVDMQFDECK